MGATDFHGHVAACAGGGQVRLALRQVAICITENRFDEQDIGSAHELDDALAIATLTADIRDVAQALAGNELQHIALELAQ